ncbi:MAG: hypothetical protein B7Z75_11710 [Acidocella sp. 20-57-95]|nr:MAG: hypothetical protein B7Z75_11710 [Acidocella sp. 20-57-95]HQT63133.1 hypothetical protein [Acidocella sp.]
MTTQNLKIYARLLAFLAIVGSLGMSLAGCVYYPARGGYSGYYAAPAYGYVTGGGGYRYHEDDDDD